MENSEEKMHLMISSAAYQQSPIVKALDQSVAKYNFHSIETVKDAATNKSPSIITAKKALAAKGRDVKIISDMLMLMLAKTARCFNVVRNIDTTQIPEVVKRIEQKFYFLKLSEIHFIFDRAVMGRNGNVYQCIDVPTIMSWFDDYVAEREIFFSSENDLKHDAETAIERSRKYDDFVQTIQKGAQDNAHKKVNQMTFSVAEKMNFNKKKG